MNYPTEAGINAQKITREETVACERLPKSHALAEAAQEIKGVINHLEELKLNLGIYEEDRPKNDEMKQGQGDNNLLTILDVLPGQISRDCSMLHRLINDIHENLI